MKNNKMVAVKQELERIRAKLGSLSLRGIVREATAKNSILHKYFCWDDKKAGEAYRLQQAAHLVRHVYVYAEAGPEKVVKVREYVSLSEDRGAGQYRHLPEVFSEADLKGLYLEDLLRDVCFFQEKLKKVAMAAERYAIISGHLKDVSGEIRAEKRKGSIKKKAA